MSMTILLRKIFVRILNATGIKRNLSIRTTRVFVMFAVARQSTQNSLQSETFARTQVINFISVLTVVKLAGREQKIELMKNEEHI